MLDAVNFERLGIPAGFVAVHKFAMTTGKGMALAQGVPNFPMATLDHIMGAVTGEHNLDAYVEEVVDQIEDILLNGPPSQAM